MRIATGDTKAAIVNTNPTPLLYQAWRQKERKGSPQEPPESKTQSHCLQSSEHPMGCLRVLLLVLFLNDDAVFITSRQVFGGRCMRANCKEMITRRQGHADRSRLLFSPS